MSPDPTRDRKCILCWLPARWSPFEDVAPFDCRRCGRFKITLECRTNLESEGTPRPFLSAATRQASEGGRSLILIITSDNYEDLEDSHRWTSVPQKSHKILEVIRSKSSFFSETIPLDDASDYPLFDAVSEKECEALLDQLDRTALISPGNPSHNSWRLTMDGWRVVEPISPGGIPGRAFVAMAFDSELDDAYYAGIKPAIVDAGYEPFCMKERLTNDNICDVILAEIRKAQFVVADFTKQKGGVYFEAGFAKALGKEVFWSCRQDDFDKLHFDTNHYGHLKWSDPADIKRQLIARIIAELGIGPFATFRS